MATTYSDTVKKVLSWANRDEEVMTPADVKDFINFGLDNAYRRLRIAPMETVRSYTTDSDDVGDYKLDIPTDLIEIIQLRKQTAANSGDRMIRPSTEWEVFEAKADVLSFYDEYLDNYAYNFYTRERGQILVSPAFADSETYELYYYRRLPEVDARYNIYTSAMTNTCQYYTSGVDREAALTALKNIVMDSEGEDVFRLDPDLEDEIYFATDAEGTVHAWLGKLTPHWLRDNNQKVLLYGALMQAGMYLADQEMEARYTERFLAEIETLNNEDNMRRVTGGHVQTRFTAYGLI